MNLSYWELKEFFNKADLCVIGSGIVGLNAAINYKQQFPKHRVVVLERGILPAGASTKNAGFACFGSVSELLSDIKSSNEKMVWDTVELRYKGLARLREILGDKQIDYKNWGGFEVFDSKIGFEKCMEVIPYFNLQVKSITKNQFTYKNNKNTIKKSGLAGVKYCIENCEEGQIDTGKMMRNLLALAYSKDISVLNGLDVNKIIDRGDECTLILNGGVELKSKNVIVATNGFARKLLRHKDVKPARAQVLVTKEIEGLKLRGAFHYDQGFYYFRNVGKRVLFGGGRNLDLKGEETMEFGLTDQIQNKLEEMLRTMILPEHKFKIEHRWSGIMGVGKEKKPIVEHVSPNVVCAVRMGGMGVAIGSLVGEMAVEELLKP
ncbi:MAG: FAD-dependent oxidoreductase [Bacteroidota bacterium]|nr:FAD-dependent oxidoreductase [Bacteroidota bacterium]